MFRRDADIADGSPQSSHWRRLRDTADRGDASVEAVMIVPIIVMLTLLVVQFVLVWHGRHVAQAAAQTAARSAAAYQADPVAGQAGGNQYLADVAPNLLPGHAVTVTQNGGTVTVTVSADVLTVIPFASFDVREQATAPREVFVTISREFSNAEGSSAANRSAGGAR